MRIFRSMQNFIQERLRTFCFNWKFSLRAGFAIFIILFSIFYFLFSIAEVLAQNNTSIDISCAKYQYPWCQEERGDIAPLVGRFYIIALGLAGAAALGVLIYGAILWTLSGAVTSKQDAKEWISGALWGLVLLLGAYLILYTINPDLVKLRGPQESIRLLPYQSQKHWIKWEQKLRVGQSAVGRTVKKEDRKQKAVLFTVMLLERLA